MSGTGKGFSTRAIHGGEWPDPATGAHGVPIYQNSTFHMGNYDRYIGVWEGDQSIYCYSRDLNPTVRHLELKMLELEGAEDCVALASGMAVISTTMLTMGAGGHVVASKEIYNTANKLVNEDLPEMGMRFTRVDITDLAAVEAAIQPDTKFIYTEVVSNPSVVVADVPALANLAHAHGLPLIIDNTFLSPATFRPIEHGADIVLHSATKYLSGHGEVLGGVVSGRKEHIDLIRKRALRLGGTLSPFAAWLILTGMRTLPLRIERHAKNAMVVARFLESHPALSEVRYPGLPANAGHSVAARLFGEEDGFGGMMSVRFHGGEPAMATFVNELKLVAFATSLGDTASLAWPIYPTDVLRLSIGLEEPNDIIADFEQAFEKVKAAGYGK
jgi:cystathionine beta-lyase/cystathionine gamma-synthase